MCGGNTDSRSRFLGRARTSVSRGISPGHFRLIDRPETLPRIYVARGSKTIPGRRFQWSLDEPISSVPMLRYTLLPGSSPLVTTPFLLFLFNERASPLSSWWLRIPGLYATWKASGLMRDITDPSSLSRPRPSNGTQKTPWSYLIREEVYSPVDSNWARNHRPLLSRRPLAQKDAH